MAYPGCSADTLAQGMAGLTMQARAGDTPVLSAFTHGNTIQLQSQSTGRNLRVVDGIVDGNGGLGKYAQFRVHVHRPGVVALQNIHDPTRWLAVFDGRAIGTGQGGPYCDLMIGEIEGRYVVLESCQSPGQRIGVLPNGSMKKAFDTGTGQHGRFIPIVLHYVQPPQPLPPIHHGLQPTAGTTPLLSMFAEGNVILLRSNSSNQNLRIIHGVVEGVGGPGIWAQFTVHVRRPGVVALQNVGDSDNWLCVEGGITRAGNGGRHCEFYVKEIEGRYVVLESCQSPGQRIGVLPNGSIKKAVDTGTGQHGRFIPIVHYTAPPSQFAPYPALSAGNTPLLSMFAEGNVIILRSNSSNQNLRIIHGVVEGVGGPGVWAQFTVHVRRPGVVALQNKGNPFHWLCVDGGITRAGNGDRHCDFYVKEIESQFIALESVMHPHHHIGILPDGGMKRPEHTGTGSAARFTPHIVSKNPRPPIVTIGSTPQPAYPFPEYTQPTAPEYPQTVVAPLGVAGTSHHLLFVFQQGAKIRLRSSASGRNLRIRNGIVDGNGGEGKFATFISHVRAEGVVSLQSVADPCNWLRITAEGLLDGGGCGLQWTEFRVKPVSSEFVSLESVAFPEWHVGILPTGEAKVGKHTRTGQHGQFYPYMPI